jgi:hypothetical protein
MTSYTSIKASLIICGIGLLSFMAINSSNKRINKQQLTAYLLNEDSHLTKADSMSHVSYSVSYWPKEIINARLLQSNGQDSSKAVENKGRYFLMRCSYFNNDLLGKPNGQYDYTALLSTVSFQLGSHIYAVLDAKDTIPLTNAIYARNYGMTGSTNVLLFFAEATQFTTCQLVINDFVFNTGQRIKLKYKITDIDNCPHLNL